MARPEQRRGPTRPPKPAQDMSEGTIHDMYDSKYLRPNDFGNKQQVVKIDRVMKEEVWNYQDAKYQDVNIVYIDNVDKGLKIPKTEGNKLVAHFGEDVRGWIGKDILLVPTKERFFGQEHFLMRVSEQLPKAAPAKVAVFEGDKVVVAETITEQQLDELEAFGEQAYGDEWAEKSSTLCNTVSKKRTGDIMELTTDEAQKLINGILKKLNDVPESPGPNSMDEVDELPFMDG